MNISVVIPNFNGQAILRKNLPSVVKALELYKEGKREIVVTDDNSTDNSCKVAEEVLQKECPRNIQWRVVKNTNRERGFSSNVNFGVKQTSGNVIVLLNSDVSPEKDFLNPLLAHFKNENVFAAGCMDKSRENGETILRGRGVGKWKRGFLVHAAGSMDKKSTLWVSGGSGAFRKSMWDILDGLTLLYNPFYWEDIDISYRAQKAGFSVIFEKQSVVIHMHEEGAIKKNYSQMKIKIGAYRNQLFFVWLNITDAHLLITHIIWFPYHIAHAIKRRDMAFLIGLFQALVQLPRVLERRREMKKLFIKTDKEILSFSEI